MRGAAFQWGALGVGAVGLALCALGALADPARAAFSYLAAFAFGTSIALGGLLWTLLAHLAGAGRLAAPRRAAESVAATLPLFALLFLPLLPGMELLYPWARPPAGFAPEVREWMARTAGYLNTPFFLVRAGIYFAVWIVAAEWLRARSARGDERLRALSAGALIAVAFTAGFAAVDWLMSLVPLWPSAAWGLYYFAGGLVGALGVVAVLGFALRREGALSVSQTHALGKLLLAAVLFWAYVAYSQYLVVWIADLPREVVWYVPRTRTSWKWVAMLLVAGHLLLPVAALLSWRLKRHAGALAAVGAWIVLMHYVDLYWIVLPALRPEGLLPHWLDLAALLGVGGIAAGFGAWRLRSRAVGPLVLLAAVSLAGCDRMGEARGLDLERMIEQPRYDPYEAGPGFPDDRVLQRPPEGTVPRERIVGRPELTTGMAPGGEPVAGIPVPVTPELLALGRKGYDVYCAVCHGAGGYGGSMVAVNMQPPLPSPLVTGHGAEHSPGYYYDVITHGQERMPPYAAELSVVERWAVVAYLTRVLQQPHPLTPEERLDSARAEVLRRRYPEAAGRHAEQRGEGHEDEGHAHEHEGHEH